jgi:tetratricopeptide (TPR) repeat protein
VLARIYTNQIGDADAKHIDEGMARRAIEQYKVISEKDPKDVDSLIMQGRLNRVVDNSVDSEASFKKALGIDPDNEDAITGLASVYSDRGDAKGSSALLEKLVSKNPSTRSLITLANNYEMMKEWGLAAEAYKKAVELDPNRAELKSGLAQDQAMAQHYDDALKTYQQIADAAPNDPTAYVRMAEIYEEQRKLDDSRRMMDKAKQAAPNNPEIIHAEARLLADENKLPEAINAMKSVLEMPPTQKPDAQTKSIRAKLLEELGGLYRKNEQIDLAVATFREMAAVDPDQAPQAAAQVVETYRLAKDYAKAQQESDAASAKYPKDRTTHMVRSELYSDQGKTEPAVAELKKLLDGKGDREIYLQMAEVYQKGHSYGEMQKVLDSAEKLSKDNDARSGVMFLRGSMYERQKKFSLAEDEFRKVLGLDPKNASAMNYLGYMLADENVRLPEAQDYIKHAVELEPNNYAFLDSLGWVYFRQNKLDEAEQQLTRAIQLFSKDPTIHDHLGDVLFKEGKLKQAIEQWQFSLKAFNATATSDIEPDDVAKVQKKLDSARVKLAKEQSPARNN